jgi:hypothetical protein
LQGQQAQALNGRQLQQGCNQQLLVLCSKQLRSGSSPALLVRAVCTSCLLVLLLVACRALGRA